MNTIRFHGVYAAHARLRKLVVPAGEPEARAGLEASLLEQVAGALGISPERGDSVSEEVRRADLGADAVLRLTRPLEGRPNVRPWTDDYSSILAILRESPDELRAGSKPPGGVL